MKPQMNGLISSAMLQKLRRHPWLAGVTGGSVFIMLVGLAAFSPQLYSANATLVVTNPKNFLLEAANREVLTNANLENLVQKFGLREEASNSQTGGDIERARQAISVDFSEGGDETKKYFVVNFHGTDPQKVREMTNALAVLYSKGKSTVYGPNVSGSSQVSQTLRKKKEQIRQQIEEQKRQILQYKDRYRQELHDQLDANKKIVTNLQSKISILLEDLKRKKSQRTALINKAILNGEAESKNIDTILPFLIHYTSDLRQELAELRTIYSETAPEVQRVQRELTSLEARIQFRSKRATRNILNEQKRGVTEKNQFSASMDLDIEISKIEAEKKKAERQLKEYQQYIDNTPRREQELQTLDLVSRKLEEQYALDFADGPAEEVEEGTVVRVLQAATLVTDSGRVTRHLFLLLGALLLGIGAALGSVFVWEKFIDTSFHSETELEDETHFPVLVTIPRII